jgi:hypothetical protein
MLETCPYFLVCAWLLTPPLPFAVVWLQILGADLVVYGDQADTELSVTSLHPTGAITRMDCSCFTGKYVTGGIDEEYFEALKMRRNDGALTQEKGESRPSEQEAKVRQSCPVRGGGWLTGYRSASWLTFFLLCLLSSAGCEGFTSIIVSAEIP